MDMLPPKYREPIELPCTDGRAAFRATDTQSGQACRILVAGPDPLALRQAHAELTRLANPNLVAAVELGQLDDGTWFRAQAWAEPARLENPQLLRLWLPGWLRGLAGLHAAGRVHGGLHPGELCLATDGTPVLASVGRGYRIGQPAESLTVDHPAWAFQAPEGRVDAASDLFMLGAVILFWLTGAAAPRSADDLGAALEALEPTDQAWADVLGGMLAPSPADRFANAGEALAACPGAAAVGLPAPAGRVAPFVGRRQELARLLTVLDEAVDTLAPRVIQLHGEAGVGKSRLLEELRQRARSRGCDVLVARATCRDGAPYAAFAPLLESLLARVPQATRKAVTPVLAALLPALGDEAPTLEPRAARSRLFAAIADLVEAAATPPGLLICLDDWHAADPASRDLLAFLGRALPPLPLCVVLASRQAPPEGGEGISLGGLARREAGALWRGLWDGKDPGGGFMSALEERTGGNPGMVEQAALHCKPLITGGRGAGAQAAVVQATLPATLQAFWRTRLLALPQPAQTLALAAAVAGARAGLALLQGVAELEEESFFEALELLGETGVLAHDGVGYTLAAPEDHVLALAGEEIEAMHQRALGHFRLAAQFGQAVPAARLAYHALEAAMPTEGAYYALDAARQALRLFALEEAEAFLTRGQAALPADAPTAWRTDYAVAKGDLARFQARAEEAETNYRQALLELAPARRPEVLTSLGIALNLVSRSEEAEALYREAIAASGADADRARAMAALARLHVRLGRAPEAAELCRKVIAMRGAGSIQRGEALGLLGLVCVNHGGDAREGLEHLGRAQMLAKATGDRLALANASMLAGNARYGLGQLEPAREEFSRYALLCQELGLPDEAVCASLNLAQVAYEQGRYVETWQRARAGAVAAREMGNKIYEAFGLSYVSLAGCQLGYLVEAEEAAREAQQVAESLGEESVLLQVGAAQLEASYFLGRLGMAEEIALGLRKRFEATSTLDSDGPIALMLGLVYALAGETTAAIEQLRRARLAAERSGNQVAQARVALGFGQVALASGQIAVAHARGQDAVALAQAAGAQLALLRAHLLVAQTAWQLQRPESTEASLAAAQAIATALASPHWQAIAWMAQSRFSPDGTALRVRAATHIQYYLHQLPPRARQEFLNWPERRDALTGRGTGALELRVPNMPVHPREIHR